MMHTDLSKIDLKKYNRIFTVGCSFTRYRYATWADIIAKEADAKLYNYGASGAGNQYISIVLNQIINKYRPGPTDLVVVMWTTFYREDKRVKESWVTPGHIYSQGEYPKEYVDKFICPAGCMMRDMATIDLNVRMLEGQNFDSFTMYSVAPRDQTLYANMDFKKNIVPKYYKDIENRLMNTYSHLTDKVQKSIFDVIFNKVWSEEGYIYEEQDGVVRSDYHPVVTDYYNYLIKLNLELSTDTQVYAEQCHQQMLTKKSVKDLEADEWPWRSHAKWPM